MPDLTRQDVELWIKEIATGDFHYTKVLDGKVDKNAYNKLRKIMHDIVLAGGVCEPVGKHDGYYRPVQELPDPVDWQSAEANQDFPVTLPFDLRKYVWIYPNSVVVVAGSKDAGKTGFLYRTAALNINRHYQVILISNMEGGKEQMKDRFAACDIEIPNPAPFLTFQASENFHDFIKYPDTLYVIDYIDVPEDAEFYKIAGLITKIRLRLNNSVAVIGLQKPRGRDIAFGGEQTLKDAALYLAMDRTGKRSGKIKIISAKKPADKTLIPRNMAWRFGYDGEGTIFTDIEQDYGDEGDL